MYESPEGECCICGEAVAARAYMRTQCYHAFHKVTLSLSVPPYTLTQPYPYFARPDPKLLMRRRVAAMLISVPQDCFAHWHQHKASEAPPPVDQRTAPVAAVGAVTVLPVTLTHSWGSCACHGLCHGLCGVIMAVFECPALQRPNAGPLSSRSPLVLPPLSMEVRFR